jgi:salicylate hydroxylase
MSTPETVAIIGGGIGGLTAALALLKRGIDVDVYEQAAQLREVGAGIQISPNGTRVLHELGLENALREVQVGPPGKKSGTGALAKPGPGTNSGLPAPSDTVHPTFCCTVPTCTKSLPRRSRG